MVIITSSTSTTNLKDSHAQFINIINNISVHLCYILWIKSIIYKPKCAGPLCIKYQLSVKTADLREILIFLRYNWGFQSSLTPIKLILNCLCHSDCSYLIFAWFLVRSNFFFSGQTAGPTYQPPVWHSNPDTPLLTWPRSWVFTSLYIVD